MVKQEAAPPAPLTRAQQKLVDKIVELDAETKEIEEKFKGSKDALKESGVKPGKYDSTDHDRAVRYTVADKLALDKEFETDLLAIVGAKDFAKLLGEPSIDPKKVKALALVNDKIKKLVEKSTSEVKTITVVIGSGGK